MANTAWQVTGDNFESCSCDYLCPCVTSKLTVPGTKVTETSPSSSMWIGAGMARCRSTISVSSSSDTPRREWTKATGR
jgi:hypothetical protein